MSQWSPPSLVTCLWGGGGWGRAIRGLISHVLIGEMRVPRVLPIRTLEWAKLSQSRADHRSYASGILAAHLTAPPAPLQAPHADAAHSGRATAERCQAASDSCALSSAPAACRPLTGARPCFGVGAGSEVLLVAVFTCQFSPSHGTRLEGKDWLAVHGVLLPCTVTPLRSLHNPCAGGTGTGWRKDMWEGQSAITSSEKTKGCLCRSVQPLDCFGGVLTSILRGRFLWTWGQRDRK